MEYDLLDGYDYPYKGRKGECDYDETIAKVGASGYYYVPFGDPNQLKAAIA